MGMADRERIVDELLASGRAAETPVAVVHWGTTQRQQVVRSTLDGLAAIDLETPAAIVIGPVAALDLGTNDSGAPARHEPDGPSRSPGGGDPGPHPGVGADRPIGEPRGDGHRTAGHRDRPSLLTAVRRLRVRSIDFCSAVYEWVACTSSNAADRLLAALGDRTGPRLGRLGRGRNRDGRRPQPAVASRPQLVPGRSVSDELAVAVPRCRGNWHGALPSCRDGARCSGGGSAGQGLGGGRSGRLSHRRRVDPIRIG